MNKETKIVQEAIDRPDSIWLSLDTGNVELHEHRVFSFEEAVATKGDFGNIKGIVVTEIPLYGDDPRDATTRYIFNQIEIHEKIKENKELLKRIGN